MSESSSNSWSIYPGLDGLNHVVPDDDLRRHTSIDCWCGPRLDDGVMVHNSMDRREEFERGERKPS